MNNINSEFKNIVGETPTEEELKMVEENLKNSYSPYSKFKVSALLKTMDDEIFLGVNVENAGIQSICAERSAFVSAISNGKRKFKYLLLTSDKKVLPCGYCRQFMAEFVCEDFNIYVYDKNTKEIFKYTLKELFPYSFKLD